MVEASIGSGVKNEISKLIDSIFRKSPTVHLYLVDVTTLANIRDGETGLIKLPNENILLEMKLNQNILPNASKEYIAATILHEAIHAYMGATNETLNILRVHQLA
ncbi:MAG: hypothetical protein V4541_00220 [Bacteroidota bacterium]